MTVLALSDLLGLPVYDAHAAKLGRVREAAILPQEDANHVSALIVRTPAGDRLVSASLLLSVNGGVHTSAVAADLPQYTSGEGMLLLERDLLDQQIIDVNGRKVVRVNDVELTLDLSDANATRLRVSFVDAGARGAIRRLLKGVVPRHPLSSWLQRIPARSIPWEAVNLIETDPARRVRLKISSERVSRLHPADIADIIEELAPAERDAVFQALDEDVAADTLEEIDPKLQASILSHMESERAADIVEEMDPDAAADLLGDLTDEHSDAILQEMQPEERQEVEDLLEFEEDTAAGRMTTDYMSLAPTARVQDAVEMLKHFEGGLESMSTIFLVGEGEKLLGAVPLALLIVSAPDTMLSGLAADPLITVSAEADEREVAELFDKYNLLTLPVVDDKGALTGVITADDVISILRSQL
ncbi:MAG: CBS domain-containing protein [Acidobacteriota bacterium]|nr:CBS domain-containing protein [Acidobacteriota bacterium]